MIHSKKAARVTSYVAAGFFYVASADHSTARLYSTLRERARKSFLDHKLFEPQTFDDGLRYFRVEPHV